MLRFILLYSLVAILCGCGGIKSTETIKNPFPSFDGINIAYDDEGSGIPVFLIHGFINDKNSWGRSALKKQLIDQGYRVIIPDLRGNGDSDKPHDPIAYKDDAEIKDLIALADHLSIESYMAVGYSRGSIVLSKLLISDERITKAVIGGMGFDFTNPEWEIPGAFAEAFSGRAELTDMTRGAVEYATSINRDLTSLALQQEYQPVTTPAELSTISIPVMILRGDQDKSNGDPHLLQAAIKDAKLTIIEGDHNNTYKQENFAAEVISFLKA